MTATRSSSLAHKLKRKLRPKYEPPPPRECTCHTGHPPCHYCVSHDPDGADEQQEEPERPATLEAYLAQYAPALAQNAQAACQPLHVPGKDQPLPVDLLREPYQAQAHVISAGIKALKRQRSVQLAAEMGTGKTILSQAICQGDSHGRGYRAIVVCPPHLVMKWERELRITLTNVHVHHLRSYHDLTRVLRDAPPVGRGWWIVSDTRAKMGTKWRPSFLPMRRSIFLRCPDCHGQIERYDNKLEQYVPVAAEELAKKKHRCTHCDAALWQWTHEIDRWPISQYIKEKLPGWFDYLICDEAHRAKGQDTAIGLSTGALTSACRKTIFLSGSFCGGYAWHFRNSLLRIAPKSLIDEGLGYDQEMKFNEVYGRLERRVTTTEKTGDDNRQSKGTTTKTAKYVRPGVMPTLFGRHLIGSTIFLSLDEVAEALPKLTEQIIDVPMDAELEAAYREVEKAITDELKTMMQKRDKRLLSRMLITLLGYPDHPYDWKEIGHFDTDEDGCQHWKHVVTPKVLSRSVIRAKEQAVVDLVRAEVSQGRKCWVYCVMTDARDVNERLRWLLDQAGLRVEVLRAKVETTEREAWIAEHMPNLDVCVSHPALTETGLDFFSRDEAGGYRYNIPSILFFSTGYSTFTLRQASRRSWRIGQKEPCKVMYLHYQDTMQSRALNLMARKLIASTSIEGKFTSEGLAAMGGDEGSMETALAKSLVDRLDDCDVGRSWGRVSCSPEPDAADRDFVEFDLPPPKHVFHQERSGVR